MDWNTVYVLATFAACVLGLLAGRREPVFAAAVLILTIWLMCRASFVLWSEPWSLAPYALFDTVGALVCYEMWRERGRWWLRALSVLFLCQLVLAAVFWPAWAFVLNPEQFAAAILNYKVGNNLLYCGELLIVGGVGGRRVGERLMDYFSGLGRARLGHALHLRRAGHPPAPTRR